MARVLGTGGGETATATEPSSSKPAAAASSKTTTGRIIDTVASGTAAAKASSTAKAAAAAGASLGAGATTGKPWQPASSLVAFAPPQPSSAPLTSSLDQLARRLPAKWPRPKWHPHWRCYRVVSGHLGWVRSLAVDPVSNEWFASGSADRTIKIWVRAFFCSFFFLFFRKEKKLISSSFPSPLLPKKKKKKTATTNNRTSPQASSASPSRATSSRSPD